MVGTPSTIAGGTDKAVWPRLVRGGDAYAVSWIDERDGSSTIWFNFLEADGAKRLPQDTKIGEATATALDRPPALASDGAGEIAVHWGATRWSRTWVTRVGNPGKTSDTQLLADSEAGEIAHSSARQQWGVVLRHWDYGEYHHNFRLPHFGAIDRGFTPRSAPLAEKACDYPVIVSVKDGYRVFFDQEVEYGNTEIFMASLDNALSSVGSPIRITTLPDKVLNLQAVAAAEHIGLVWQEWSMGFGSGFGKGYFMQVDQAGNVKTSPTQVADEVWAPRLVWTGNEYLVMLKDGPSLKVQPISAEGQLSATPFTFAEASFRENGDAAWNGTELGVVWEESERLGFHRLTCN